MGDDWDDEDTPVQVQSGKAAQQNDSEWDDGGGDQPKENGETNGHRGGGRGGGRGGRGGGRGRGGRGGGGDRNRDREDGDGNGGDDGGDNRESRRGRGGGRGRGGRRGGEDNENGDDQDNGEGDGGDGGDDQKEPEVEKERYIADEITEETVFEERSKLYASTSGINFDDFDNIPVNATENRTTGAVLTFEEMGLRKIILDNVKKVGYKKPTPIQKHGSPILMNGQDLMACAQTGSGKTAAFLLPIINDLLSEDHDTSGNPCKPKALVLAPTRELALQIEKECFMYSAGSVLKTRVVYGGTMVGAQRNRLLGGVHILIATPGRLKMFLTDKSVSLENIKYFVLDEADRMLDQGFMPDIEEIVKNMTPKENRISAMFSATFPEAIRKVATDFLRDFVLINIGMVGGASKDVEQTFLQVGRREKRDKVMELLRALDKEDKVLIFTNSKKNADFLAAHLSTNEVSATSIHGDRMQSQRERALLEFKHGIRKVLVATAVAARGLDIPKVSMVINYELPTDLDEYIHRIGRTGRVGHKGKSISFYDPESDNDQNLVAGLKAILEASNQLLPDFFDGIDAVEQPDESASAGGAANGGGGGGGDDEEWDD